MSTTSKIINFIIKFTLTSILLLFCLLTQKAIVFDNGIKIVQNAEIDFEDEGNLQRFVVHSSNFEYFESGNKYIVYMKNDNIYYKVVLNEKEMESFNECVVNFSLEPIIKIDRFPLSVLIMLMVVVLIFPTWAFYNRPFRKKEEEDEPSDQDDGTDEEEAEDEEEYPDTKWGQFQKNYKEFNKNH